MLRIADLTHVKPNGTRALDGVTLEVPRGMFGLLGPNGAGKSSLMRCIATLQIPTRGSIRFDDLDVLGDPDALRRTLGYLPQDFGVYPRVSALDMLDHLAVLKGIADRGARRATVEALLQPDAPRVHPGRPNLLSSTRYARGDVAAALAASAEDRSPLASRGARGRFDRLNRRDSRQVT